MRTILLIGIIGLQLCGMAWSESLIATTPEATTNEAAAIAVGQPLQDIAVAEEAPAAENTSAVNSLLDVDAGVTNGQEAATRETRQFRTFGFGRPFGYGGFGRPFGYGGFGRPYGYGGYGRPFGYGGFGRPCCFYG